MARMDEIQNKNKRNVKQTKKKVAKVKAENPDSSASIEIIE